MIPILLYEVVELAVTVAVAVVVTNKIKKQYSCLKWLNSSQNKETINILYFYTYRLDKELHMEFEIPSWLCPCKKQYSCLRWLIVSKQRDYKIFYIFTHID